MKKNSAQIFLVFLLLSFPLLGQTKPITFAWLSDTHVGNSTGESDLSISMNDINKMKDIDFTLISGDISQTGRTYDLKKAKKILDSLKMPYHIIPGNHDTKWSESGGTQFVNIWNNDRFVFEADKNLFIGLHQGPIMRMSEGHFAPEDIRWLDSVLQTIDKSKAIIFVSHYPLDQSITNWYEVLDLLKKKNIELILCGHGHNNNTFSFEGIPGVMGRSDLRAKDKPGGFNIVEMKNDSIFFFERIPATNTKNLWHKIKLEQIDFSKDTTKYLRPDFSINKKYPNVKVKWSTRENFLITSSAGFSKDKIFIGNSGGEFTAYSSSNGILLWKFKTAGKVFSSAAVYNNLVLFGSTDSNLYCLNAKDGKLIWKHKAGGPILCSPVVEKNIVYFASGDYSFNAVDLPTNNLLWNFTGLNGFVETKPWLTKNSIIFGAWDSYLYALDKTTGNFKWKWNNGRIEELYSPAACEPVASNGKVFIAAPDRFLTAIDENTGEIIWRSNKHQVRESIGISSDGKTIFSRTMNDSVFAFSPSENQLKEKWIVAANYGYDFNPGSIVEQKGKIFFGTRNGLVYCMNSKNGKILWIYKIGVSSVNKITAVSSSNIIASDMSGNIISLKF
ncbi:MAG: metallophosphoesterase [Ignavibacteriales bacterium]|nr:MAG: metallophosphoesterase [Ignavibacteriales bacterium]